MRKVKTYTKNMVADYLRQNYKFLDDEITDILKQFKKEEFNMFKDTFKRAVENKVIAHIRHTQTNYEKQLDKCVGYSDYIFIKDMYHIEAQRIARRMHR